MAKPGLYRVRAELGGSSSGTGDAWGDPVDDDIVPDTDSVRTIGSSLKRFVNIFLDALNVAGNITVTGTVDGRDLSTDGTKLDGIEDSATADQTDAEIETAYNNQVAAASQAQAEAGTGTSILRWTAQRIAQAIAALETYGSASELLTAIKTVDGTGSGLDADTLDGSEATAFEPADADILKADTDDTLTAGFGQTTDNDGTQSSGTYTPTPNGGNFKRIVNGGAFTLAPPSTDCNLVIQITNNASAGAITTSGFTQKTGDSFDTTDGNDFLCYVTKINGFSHLNVVAMQ